MAERDELDGIREVLQQRRAEDRSADAREAADKLMKNQRDKAVREKLEQDWLHDVEVIDDAIGKINAEFEGSRLKLTFEASELRSSQGYTYFEIRQEDPAPRISTSFLLRIHPRLDGKTEFQIMALDGKSQHTSFELDSGIITYSIARKAITRFVKHIVTL